MKKMQKSSFVFLSMILSGLLVSQQVYSATPTANSATTNTTPAPAASTDAPPLSQAAASACADKEKGDACAFTNEKGDSIDGHCGFASTKLVCVAYQ